MRKETKIGIVIGIIITVATVLYFVLQEKEGPKPAYGDSLFAGSDTTDAGADNKSPEIGPDDSAPTEPVGYISGSDADNIDPDTTGTDPGIDVDPDEGTSLSPTELVSNPAGEEPVELQPQVSEPIANPIPAVTDPLANLPESYPQQMNEPRYHLVKKGDSLYSISNDYFGTGKYWEAIYKVNKGTITNASSLRIGWKLRIPSPEEIEAN